MAEVAALFKQFIYRDLAFIFGGSIVLLSLAYAFRDCIPNGWQIAWPGIVLIVLAAYVVGYTVQDIGGVLRLTPTGRLQPGWLLRRLYKCFTRVEWRDTDCVAADDREFTFDIRLCRPDITERVIQELERIRSLKVFSMRGRMPPCECIDFFTPPSRLAWNGASVHSRALPCLFGRA